MVAICLHPVGAGVYNVYTGVLTDVRPARRAHRGPAGPGAAPVLRRLRPPDGGAGPPDGWWAKCSRHGLVDSADLEAQR